MSKTFTLCVLLLCSSAFAETTDSQSQPVHCTLSQYVCNSIPFVGGGTYSFVLPAAYSQAGTFDIVVKGLSENGEVTATHMPTWGVDGPFSLDFVVPSHTGKVTGTIHFESVGRWKMPWIESSTVTFD